MNRVLSVITSDIFYASLSAIRRLGVQKLFYSFMRILHTERPISRFLRHGGHTHFLINLKIHIFSESYMTSSRQRRIDLTRIDFNKLMNVIESFFKILIKVNLQ